MKEEGLEPRIAELLRPVRLVALDVDGTLTDGGVYVTEDGEATRYFVIDGWGIKTLQQHRVEVAFISGRKSKSAERRARDLGVGECHLGVASKDVVLREIQQRLAIERRETVAMGDDLPDLALQAGSGCFVAPANARAEIMARADFVTRAAGGAGAVRELAELILRAQGRWQAVVSAYGG